ncbi:MAG: glycosyltransferase family 2 protein [Candidatus Obscuribacterales bacterium]|nr:glycosyltransferase family 2 protein [Candidatus Obscuribacterales bacterium]
MPELSVIIPAYNEESRLPATLASVCDFLGGRGRSFEVLVVDDGSDDATTDMVMSYGQKHPEVRVLSYQPNRGKGYAVRTGIMAAKGDYLLIDDADGSSPIAEVERLEKAIAGGADVAIGSRAKPDESRKVEALAHRKFVGNTFNYIVQSLLLPGILDTQCGFKLFKREIARDVFSVNRIDGFGFDVEVLHIARTRNYKIAEVAINWVNMEGSKVNVLVDSPKMLVEVFKVACLSWFGFYRRGNKVHHTSEVLIGSAKREHEDAP